MFYNMSISNGYTYQKDDPDKRLLLMSINFCTISDGSVIAYVNY